MPNRPPSSSGPSPTFQTPPVEPDRPGPSRTPRPTGCPMPTPPTYTRSSSAHDNRGDKTTEGPEGSPSQARAGQSQRFSPGETSQTAPLSPGPSSNNAFIFPIRSVFQNKPQSGQGQAHGQGDDRPTGGSRPASEGRPSPSYGRRFSQSLYDDAGISTIQQLLEEGSGNEQNRDKRPSGQTGVATFSGKVDRSSSGQGQKSTSPGPVDNASESDQKINGFFSMPSMVDREVSRSPFFADEAKTRRQSIAGGHISRTSSRNQQKQPDRPEPVERTNDQTVTPEPHKPQNPSTTAPGSGLPDPHRPPVGQPSRAPDGVNFRHRPGGESLEASTSFKSVKSPDTATANKIAKQNKAAASSRQDAVDVKEDTTLTNIQQPKPRSVGSGPMPGLSGSDTSSGQRNAANIATEADGEQTLIQDFTNIVRLAEPGSLSSGQGTATGTGSGGGSKGNGSVNGSANSQPAVGGGAPSMMASQRRNARDTTRDSVRDFVQSQAHQTNLSDPNAHTTFTPINEEREGEGVVIPDTPPPRPPIEEVRPHVVADNLPPRRPSRAGVEDGSWVESSEASMSVRDSSEQATGSAVDKDDDGTDDEDPIVTFRFEHSQNEDGHHVVVGREGKLRSCEDEPITTPGAVQGFGVLMVIEEDYDTGDLVVRQVSENATELLGLSPKYLFRLSCFSKILTTDQEDLLRDNLEYLPDPQGLEPGREGIPEDGPQVFLLSGYGEPGSDEPEDDADDMSDVAGRRREWTCWVAAHRPAQPHWRKTDSMGEPIDAPELVILEFELERDPYNPLVQPFDTQNFDTSSGLDSRSGGAATPDSNSQATASVGSQGSGPRRTTSFGSGGDSNGSATTVGTTPRPATLQSDTSDSGTALGKCSGKSSSSSATPKPSVLATQRGAPKPQGLEGVELEMPLERIIESTTNHAKPLRALERMRRTGMQSGEDSTDAGSGSVSTARRGARARRPRRAQGGSTGTMDVFAVLGQINEQLGSAPDLETFLKITVGVVQDLCRFHRVLLYQFDENFNGQVVAELVEWGKTTDLFKGLMFPAADIPAQARKLYAINKVRLLYDRSQTTARMVLRSRQDLDQPIDMTHCYLRAMSPIHIKYLQNMGVRSSMSVSIMAFGQLWGLIACHSYGHHGMRVSFPVRQMMRLLSDSISKNIERLSYAQRLHTRKLISTIPTTHHPTGYIVSNADDLLQIFDAESGLLVIGDGCKLLGNNEQGQAMLSIAEYLRVAKFDSMRSSSHLRRDFPDLVLPRADDTMAGMLYVPLTAKAGQDFIVFLRKGQSREVQWAGKPYKDEQSGDAASLEPRRSFKTWSETVTGRSRSWTDDQLESAGVLALIYGKFIQVWREKQSAMASNQLTAILLSNTSHAVRTPLSQIINTLELALAGDIDPDTRSMLENSHQASRALLFHVHDLLDLTRIETGNETAFNDPFDLRQTVNDAVRLYQNESKRRGLDFRVSVDDNLPKGVIGDSRKIRTVISNLVANSVKFTEEGSVDVSVGLHVPEGGPESIRPGHVGVEIVIADTGCGIPTAKLERMFVTLEGAEEPEDQRTHESTGLGLGLAVVARIVEQLGGQLRAESEENVGSKFFFTLQMLEFTGGTIATMGTDSLISNGEGTGVYSGSRTGSSGGGSIASLRSSRSAGQQSEIDSFVQDFGGSHMANLPVPSDDRRLRDAEARMSRPGTFSVTDSSYPVRPTKMDSTDAESSASGASAHVPLLSASPRATSRPKLGMPRQSTRDKIPQVAKAATSSDPKRSASMRQRPSSTKSQRSSVDVPTGSSAQGAGSPKPKLRILVVEDDAINSQILQKRLKMDKHTPLAVPNGQEAVDRLNKDWKFDAVLMDIQMPIMDGRTAAKEIRRLEAKPDHPNNTDSLRVDNRIPIFAVSASLYEYDRANLSQHFDGWLLKPLDFTRVRSLLAALQDPAKRDTEVYVQGHWERGGYFRGSTKE